MNYVACLCNQLVSVGLGARTTYSKSYFMIYCLKLYFKYKLDIIKLNMSNLNA